MMWKFATLAPVWSVAVASRLHTIALEDGTCIDGVRDACYFSRAAVAYKMRCSTGGRLPRRRWQFSRALSCSASERRANSVRRGGGAIGGGASHEGLSDPDTRVLPSRQRADFLTALHEALDSIDMMIVVVLFVIVATPCPYLDVPSWRAMK